jgi:peptidoglycan/xylan/chitin deacetylase (PgdA/CDA1 family)
MTIYGRHGNIVRLLYLVLAIVWYILTVVGRLVRKKSVVLCYHGVCPEQKYRFERQIAKIVGSFPDVRITFDDAFENLIENALPTLIEFKMSASIFAVPGNLGHTPQWNISSEHPEYHEKTMSAQQLKMIQSDLITIGSHTQTHSDLTKLTSESIRWELVESKKNLEQLLGKTVDDLALPHGAYNQDVLDIAREAGYKRIYTLEPSLANYDQEGKIGRFSMSPDVWPIEFYLTCCGAYSWLFYFRKLIRGGRLILKGNK